MHRAQPKVDPAGYLIGLLIGSLVNEMALVEEPVDR